AGFTGVEMAGELAEFVPVACEKFGIDPATVKVNLLDALSRIMPIIPKKVTDKAMRRFEKMGVDVKLETKITGLSDGGIEYEVGGKKVVDSSRTVIWSAGTECSDIALASGELGLEPKTRGRIRTDKFLRSENDKNVYVAGDNMFYIPEGSSTAVPQMVENCEHCAKVIATNIMSEAAGEQPQSEYKPSFHGVMVSIGGRYASAYVGTSAFSISLASFIAMLSKHVVNMIYFVQVLGWNKVGAYIYAEFFTVRNRRSFVGGHFSNRTPSFLLMPLRVFMGMFFVYYAYKRFTLGWLGTDMLGPYFESLRGVFRPSLFEFQLWNQFRFSLFVLDGYVNAWFQTTPFSWFVQTFVIASDAQIMFWQWAIVLTTLLVGLALAAGWFTTLASLYVVFYSIVYVLSSGLSLVYMWMPFAGIAMMFSGGKVLAFDYYFMPWLKKKWRKIGWVKKWYLFND
ncbi:MAG: FAD-dependent oxidoreductase, partial [Treponema sp.]|nr:FAD-dependent oxidoreductase [Treponema sp.]